MGQQSIEKQWAEEKYRVMFHSQRHYHAIRIAMREKREAAEIETLIEEALQMTPTNGSMSNACQHMWGYFKKYALLEEKKKYMDLLEQKEFEGLLKYLYLLAKKYEVIYLLNSRVLEPKA